MVNDFSEIGAFNNYPSNINPLRDARYKFVIRKLPTTNFFCQKTKIPKTNLTWSNKTVQATPFSDIPLPPTGMDFADMSIDFIVDEAFINYMELSQWIQGLGFVKDFNAYAQLKSEITDVTNQFGGIFSEASLFVLNNQSVPLVEICFHRCFPWTLSELIFDSTKEYTEPLIATAQFKYIYYDINPIV